MLQLTKQALSLFSTSITGHRTVQLTGWSPVPTFTFRTGGSIQAASTLIRTDRTRIAINIIPCYTPVRTIPKVFIAKLVKAASRTAVLTIATIIPRATRRTVTFVGTPHTAIWAMITFIPSCEISVPAALRTFPPVFATQ